VEASIGTTLTEIFGVGPILAAKCDSGNSGQRFALPKQGSLLRLL
jgi:hypothetical protein